MGFGRLILAVVGAALCAGSPLDDYVKKADHSYTYKPINHFTQDNCTIYILNMTSQKWMDEKVSSRPLWVHDVMIVVPNKIISRDTAFLIIAGGSNGHKPPVAGDETTVLGCAVAKKAQTLSVLLRQIPNEPITFWNDPKRRRRKEDDIIAWTWKMFHFNVSNPYILLHLPMTKAVVRAMDTVADFGRRIPGKFSNITKFYVAGASKRGWTSWTAAAVDKRIVGFSPVVFDLLNMRKSLHHQFRALGNWSFALQSYHECSLMETLDSTQYAKMAAIIDPYNYRDRLVMPKYIMSAAGDEFFPLDDSHYYYDQLKGPTYLRIVPNAEHTLFPHYVDAFNSITAFHQAVVTNFPLPKFTWHRQQTSIGGYIILYTKTKPLNVRAYYARTISNKRRDFRWVIGKPGKTTEPYPRPILWFSDRVSNLGNGEYKAEYRRPIEGWCAFFIEVSYRGPNGTTLKFTTGVNIIPDVFPFPDCSGQSCGGGLV